MATEHIRCATPLLAGQQKICSDVPVVIRCWCSIRGCAGGILDRAVLIGQDATQRTPRYVELSKGDGGTHDSDGVLCCAIHGGGWVSRIFSGGPRTGVSRSGRSRHLLPHVCLRALCPWHLVAKASGVLSRGRCVWCDGVSYQLYASGHSAPHDRRPNIFHFGVAG